MEHTALTCLLHPTGETPNPWLPSIQTAPTRCSQTQGRAHGPQHGCRDGAHVPLCLPSRFMAIPNNTSAPPTQEEPQHQHHHLPHGSAPSTGVLALGTVSRMGTPSLVPSWDMSPPPVRQGTPCSALCPTCTTPCKPRINAKCCVAQRGGCPFNSQRWAPRGAPLPLWNHTRAAPKGTKRTWPWRTEKKPWGGG